MVHQHFGHAQAFQIVDVDGEEYRFVETRQTNPVCGNFSHQENAFAGTADLLADCEAVVAARIGPAASDYMNGRGIRALTRRGVIEEILRSLVSEKTLEDTGYEEELT
jgi:nitrogen fixation protein NifB